MSFYRINAYQPPPRLSWKQRLICWVNKLERRIFCALGSHLPQRHAAALGWCRACRAPLLQRVAPGICTWRRIELSEWERLHMGAVLCGYDPVCAARADVLRWN